MQLETRGFARGVVGSVWMLMGVTTMANLAAKVNRADLAGSADWLMFSLHYLSNTIKY